MTGEIKDMVQAAPLRCYPPQWTGFTGSVNGAILLYRAWELFEEAGFTAFPKFKLPCKHPEYREGADWCAELGFTKKEFEGALDKVAFKFTAKALEERQQHDRWLEMRTDRSRVTYYSINQFNLGISLNPKLGFSEIEELAREYPDDFSNSNILSPAEKKEAGDLFHIALKRWDARQRETFPESTPVDWKSGKERGQLQLFLGTLERAAASKGTEWFGPEDFCDQVLDVFFARYLSPGNKHRIHFYPSYIACRWESIKQELTYNANGKSNHRNTIITPDAANAARDAILARRRNKPV